MRKPVPIPGMNEKQAGLTFEEVAQTYPWLAPDPGPEALRRMMLAIGRHASARAAHVGTDPTEEFAHSLQSAAAALRAMAAFDPHETTGWLVDEGSLQPAADVGDEMLAFQIARHDEQLRIAGQLIEISARARELQAAIANFQQQNEITLLHQSGDEEPLRREFILVAAQVWRTTTGKAPKRSRPGPFARFCTVAWMECKLPPPPTKTLFGAMGAAIERYLPKVPQQLENLLR